MKPKLEQKKKRAPQKTLKARAMQQHEQQSLGSSLEVQSLNNQILIFLVCWWSLYFNFFIGIDLFSFPLNSLMQLYEGSNTSFTQILTQALLTSSEVALRTKIHASPEEIFISMVQRSSFVS